jgi:EAL domain-containing protein (putative c-di-GMP-specific phosphodiesterase class I)/GGDEF domain-containing protein
MREHVLEMAEAYAARMSVRRVAMAISLASIGAVSLIGLSALASIGAWPQLAIYLAATLGVCAAAQAVAAAKFKPLTEMAHELEASSEGQGARLLPTGDIDALARMRINVEALAQRLEKLKRRRRRHALTGLPLQEEFLQVAADDIDAQPRSVRLGLVRLANLDAITAFDPATADRALAEFAKRLRGALDATRLLAHVDRDCFAIWFRGVAPDDESGAELQALSYVLAQEIEAGALTITPDVQIGSALYPGDSRDAANLLSRAFVSLARPQRAADGRLAFFAPRSPEAMRRRFVLEQKLIRAIEAQQFQLHYQPLIDVRAGKTVGAEALLRWRHPELGEVSPAEFVPILEQAGLIEEVGFWTMNAACRDLRAWRDEGLDLKLAINISARQFRDPLLGKMLARTLAAQNLTPGDLELELTETAAMEDRERTLALLNELREAGFGLALDDFGSGYSSLGYLKNLPVTKLKIDREFVSHLDLRPGSRAICKALVELCTGLDIAVLAEGVERREEVDTLARLGCATFQGFFFSRAVPASEFGAAARKDWRALLQSPVHLQHSELRRRVSE